MNIEKLKLLIAAGEGLTVEFKEKYTSKINRDIVAFANTKGGKRGHIRQAPFGFAQCRQCRRFTLLSLPLA